VLVRGHGVEGKDGNANQRVFVGNDGGRCGSQPGGDGANCTSERSLSAARDGLVQLDTGKVGESAVNRYKRVLLCLVRDTSH
jgi:hypothetical protein